ncbi:uncharacterized protein LOC123507170 isoform X2 [Portunus trituberculatus]|uniref:uncharacterized protein LOC123507170 isoform X2 n=1 Tax=Portunus trituberculatus TaxID=210409 RepID=UPI001E1D1402|nr:uncharacterized protein LOC123507170 isoform X2 [Portunus trituberculatus]
MNTYILLHHLLLLMFFLVLPRLSTVPSSVLVLGRVGYIPGQGIYACFTRMGGAAPDLSLQYSATYTYGSAKTLATCNENISLQTSLLDGSVAYCLPPCPGMEKIYPNPISIVITGHDRVTRNIYAALMESVFIQDVTPTITQLGQGVVEVQWAARPGRTYQIQLWHYPQTPAKATQTIEEVEAIEMMKNEIGKIKESVTKIDCGSEAIEGVGELFLAGDRETEGSQQASIEGQVKGNKGLYGQMKDNDISLIRDEVMNDGKLSNKGRIVEKIEELSEKTVDGCLTEKVREIQKDVCGVMSNETLMKVKQCYHDLDIDDDVDDDDDNDNDDDDHEEDNDDFVKFMRWRKCVALHTICTKTPSASTLAPLDTSRPLICPPGLCFYYFMNVPTSGSVSVEVMDTTKDVVSSSHTPPAALRKWRSLIIDKVLLSSEDTETGLGTKTLVMEFSGALQKNTQGSSNTGTLENGGQTVIGVESVKGDYVALIVNGHDHSQVLKTVQAECDPLGRVCSVSGLQVLVDPGQGPVSNIFILLTNRHTAASSLFFLTDVHVRVHKVAPGTAIVMWDREPSVQEFIVRVVHASGETFGSVTVACSKRGSDCLATFNNLARGQYQAEVCYKRKSKVVLAFQFFMEDDIGIEYRK